MVNHIRNPEGAYENLDRERRRNLSDEYAGDTFRELHNICSEQNFAEAQQIRYNIEKLQYP